MKQKLNSVLLIDDDTATNFINSFVLKQSDCTEQIIIKESAMAALDYLKTAVVANSLPDLIFLDINMPCMNGWEFLEQYSLLDKTLTDHIVVVMLTTSQNPDDEAKAAGLPQVAAFRSKPLSKEKISQIIQSFFPQYYLKAV